MGFVVIVNAVQKCFQEHVACLPSLVVTQNQSEAKTVFHLTFRFQSSLPGDRPTKRKTLKKSFWFLIGRLCLIQHILLLKGMFSFVRYTDQTGFYLGVEVQWS